MTNNQLEGHVEQMVTSLVDHPNWEIFKEAGYPWERVEEFFGLEGKQWLDASSEFREEAEHRAKERMTGQPALTQILRPKFSWSIRGAT